MRSLHYIVLTITLFALPSFILIAFGERLGSLSSYTMFALLLGYFMLFEKHRPVIPFIILGLSYYLISSLIYLDDYNDFINEFIKYLIFIVCGTQLAKNTTNRQFIFVLLLGAMSILVHAIIYSDDYGRYSGFYLNPNGAGFVCLIGYSLSYGLKEKKRKLLFQLLFTVAGILTFSRTFIVIWLLITLVSAIIKKENMVNLGAGIFLFVMTLGLASILNLNPVRLSMFENLISNSSGFGSEFEMGSRTDNWSVYYENIIDKPIFGNGFKALSGQNEVKQGVHNTFLLVLGEAGIIPFLIFIYITLKLLIISFSRLKTSPEFFYLSIVLVSIFFVSHVYFTNYLLLFTSLWLYDRINNYKEETIT